AAGANNGANWNDAFTNLQSALTAAQNGDEVRVAMGTYKPAPAGGSRTVSFHLASGVQILGGYAGQGADPDARDPATYVTTASGDINGSNTGNSYHVVNGSNVDATALLDGSTITAGNAAGPPPGNSGGGVFILSGSPHLENCRITGNRTAQGNGLT